jgi:hypothetical protein
MYRSKDIWSQVLGIEMLRPQLPPNRVVTEQQVVERGNR